MMIKSRFIQAEQKPGRSCEVNDNWFQTKSLKKSQISNLTSHISHLRSQISDLKLRLISALITARKLWPKTLRRTGGIHAFVTKPQCLFVEHMTLKPNFSGKSSAHIKRPAAKRARIHQHFQFQPA